jgi:hypothetical protein
MEKYGRRRQAKVDNREWCMHIGCWIPKVTSTHSEYSYILVSHRNNGYTNAHQYYVYMYIGCLDIHIYVVVVLAVSDCSVENEGPGKETVGKT